MRKALTLLATIAALAACGSSDDTTDRPGNPDVYERIAGLTDCAALQQEFDTADAGSGEAATGYMKAADERMRQLDCY